MTVSGKAAAPTLELREVSKAFGLYVNQATAEGIAKVEVDMITEQIGDSGEIAILSALANATNQNAWIDLMKTVLLGDPFKFNQDNIDQFKF
jgi:hypothetical protein